MTSTSKLRKWISIDMVLYGSAARNWIIRMQKYEPNAEWQLTAIKISQAKPYQIMRTFIGGRPSVLNWKFFSGEMARYDTSTQCIDWSSRNDAVAVCLLFIRSLDFSNVAFSFRQKASNYAARSDFPTFSFMHKTEIWIVFLWCDSRQRRWCPYDYQQQHVRIFINRQRSWLCQSFGSFFFCSLDTLLVYVQVHMCWKIVLGFIFHRSG